MARDSEILQKTGDEVATLGEQLEYIFWMEHHAYACIMRHHGRRVPRDLG
jgi:hypothetical protein